MEGYSEVILGDFLLNAGVVGLLRVFDYADEYCGGCHKGEDYIINGQRIFISNDFLLNRDIGELFVGAMVHYLGSSTKLERVTAKKAILDALYAAPKPEDKQWKKSVDELYKEFSEMLLKSSFKSGYVILSTCSGINSPTESMALALKSESDYSRKKILYDELWSMLRQEKVWKILCFKDLLYSVINMFYADNKGNGAAFLSQREIDPAAAYNEKFLHPLRKSVTEKPSKSIMSCISCGSAADRKYCAPITLFVDTADDLGKKKSYYWNCSPDAYLCPLCAFICSMAPLGFTFIGSDGVFINNNSDVETLWGFANVINEAHDESVSPWYTLFNTLTSEKIRHLSHRISNIQVVLREKRNINNKEIVKYRLNTISKRSVTVFNQCLKLFEGLRKRFVKNGKEYINVYQETAENVVGHRNQFPLMSKLLHLSLDGDRPQTEYIFSILLIQIAQKGGERMENNVKRAYAAKKQGEALRAKLTEGVTEADKDNKLRGLVYQMLSAVSLGNRDKFMELALRTYAGQNLPVPDIFFSCFNGDEDFKQIGFAYLLGLKSAGYKKEEGAQ